MSSLREAILSTASRPTGRWIDRLPDDVRDELLAIRREWRDGMIQASGRGLAAAIVANCKERGITVCGVCGVREWLTAKD